MQPCCLADPAFFYDSFESRELYDATVAFAAKYGLLLWSNSETCALAAKEAGTSVACKAWPPTLVQ
eukprot:1158109-Pelagomonas_calceolata.AAC.4